MNERDMSHITEFVDQSKQMLIEYGECCLTAATGWGKSAATTVILKHFNEDALVICPSHSIKDQWIKGVMEMSGVYNMSLLTYQYFTRHYMELLNKFKIVIFDEAHHMGSPVWGAAIEDFRRLSTNNPYIFGLTAETFRQSDGEDIAETVFHNHIVSAHNYEEAIRDGILPPATYVYAMYDTAGIEEEFVVKDGDNDTIRDLKGRLMYTLQNRTKISTILKKHAPKACKGIIFVDNIMSVPIGFNLALEAFPNKPIRYIHSGLPRSEVDHTLEDFRKMKSGFIIAIDMLNEGVHVDGVNTVVMLRKTWSRRIYKQQMGRALSPKSKDVTIFDFVANYVSVAEAAQHIMDFGKFECDGEGKGIEPSYSRQSIVYDYVSDILSILEDIEYERKSATTNGKWSKEEDDILREHYPKIGPRVITMLPGRSKSACTSRANALKIKYLARNWSDDEDAILIEHFPKVGGGVTALLPNRSGAACRIRAKKLGLLPPQREWTPSELGILKEYYPHMGKDIILLLPNRSVSSCMHMAHELGIHYTERNTSCWSADEDEILRKFYPDIGPDVSNKLPGRTPEACKSRARTLGVKVCRAFTAKEDAILLEHYPKEGEKCFKLLPNRSYAACKYRLNKLGLRVENVLWTKAEDDILRKYYPDLGGKVFKMLPGRTKYACQKRAVDKLGLRYKR